MIIEGNTIVVKSFPENWEVEHSGKKANTVRQVSDFEWEDYDMWVDEGVLYSKDSDIVQIKVINTDTKEEFVRTLTNVTYWYTLNTHILILSWDSAERR